MGDRREKEIECLWLFLKSSVVVVLYFRNFFRVRKRGYFVLIVLGINGF